MAGRLAGQLHDPLAQIGVDHFDAVPLEERVQVALFGQHRLAFDDAAHAVLLEHAQHDLVVLGRIASPMHAGTQPRCVLLELFEIIGQARSVWALIASRPFAQRFPFGQRLGRLVALGAHEPQRAVVPMGCAAGRR